jgi:transcriptional regulator with XRE-family HTH domain
MATAKDPKKMQRHGGGRPRHLQRNELGRRIERLAARRNIQLDEIAEASGVRLPTLYRISTGRISDPKLSTLQAIAGALGVPVSRLIAPR